MGGTTGFGGPDVEEGGAGRRGTRAKGNGKAPSAHSDKPPSHLGDGDGAGAGGQVTVSDSDSDLFGASNSDSGASDEDEVRFGLVHGMEPVWTTTEGFDPRQARRLLRAQAAAPPNPRLSRDLGGDAAFGDAIGRWVAAGMRLRTLRMLLDASR